MESIFPQALSDRPPASTPIRREMLEAPNEARFGRIGMVLAVGLAGLAAGAVLSRHMAAPPVPTLVENSAVTRRAMPTPPVPVPAALTTEGAQPSDTPPPPALRLDQASPDRPLGETAGPAVSLSSPAPRALDMAKPRARRPAVVHLRALRSPRGVEAPRVAGGSLDASVAKAFSVALRAGVGSDEMDDYRERWNDLREDPSWRPAHRPAAYQALVDRLYKAAARAARKRERA